MIMTNFSTKPRARVEEFLSQDPVAEYVIHPHMA
jgi:hypothetical protein